MFAGKGAVRVGKRFFQHFSEHSPLDEAAVEQCSRQTHVIRVVFPYLPADVRALRRAPLGEQGNHQFLQNLHEEFDVAACFGETRFETLAGLFEQRNPVGVRFARLRQQQEPLRMPGVALENPAGEKFHFFGVVGRARLCDQICNVRTRVAFPLHRSLSLRIRSRVYAISARPSTKQRILYTCYNIRLEFIASI